MYLGKRLLLLCFILIALVSCRESKVEPFYRNGMYEIYDKDFDMRYLIIREDSIQREYNLSTGDSSKYHVEWINDSLYTLQLTEASLALMEAFANRTLHVNLKEIYPDSLVASTWFDGAPTREQIVMHRKKPSI